MSEATDEYGRFCTGRLEERERLLERLILVDRFSLISKRIEAELKAVREELKERGR